MYVQQYSVIIIKALVIMVSATKHKKLIAAWGRVEVKRVEEGGESKNR